MNRRSALRNLAIVSAGVALLPSCMQHETAATIKLHNFKITGKEEQALADLTDYLIPKTSTPGAKEMNAHAFALTMVDDCYSKEEREKFVAGFKAFNDLTNKQFSGTFSKMTTEQKATLLKALESRKDVAEDALTFYDSMKRLTIQSYTSSKYFLLEVRKYEMVPGRYHGCVPVNATS